MDYGETNLSTDQEKLEKKLDFTPKTKHRSKAFGNKQGLASSIRELFYYIGISYFET